MWIRQYELLHLVKMASIFYRCKIITMHDKLFMSQSANVTFDSFCKCHIRLLSPALACSLLLLPALACSCLLLPAPACSRLLLHAPVCSRLLLPALACPAPTFLHTNLSSSANAGLFFLLCCNGVPSTC